MLIFGATIGLPFALSQTAYLENPGTDGNGNYEVGPEFKKDKDLMDQGNPKGKLFEFKMALAESKIFKGMTRPLIRARTYAKRRIFVYVPAAYRDGTKAPILVMHDGPSQLNLVRNALDNLTVSKDPDRKLPPFVAISVENGGNDGKGSQRGLEYDTMSIAKRDLSMTRFCQPFSIIRISVRSIRILRLRITHGSRCDGVQFRWCSRSDNGLV